MLNGLRAFSHGLDLGVRGEAELDGFEDAAVLHLIVFVLEYIFNLFRGETEFTDLQIVKIFTWFIIQYRETAKVQFYS